MVAALIAALLGAIVGFAGTYLLQRGQFRRTDLDGLTERLGIARRLRADLEMAALLCESSIKNEALVPGTQFPADLWVSAGHRVIGGIERQDEQALIQAFNRFVAMNALMGAHHDPQGIPLTGESLGEDDLQRLIGIIGHAISILDQMESEYEARERRLRHPVRDRLPW